MKYFPLRDPLSDAVIIPAGKDFLVVNLYIEGELRGQVRVHHAELAAFLDVIGEPAPVAEYDELFDQGVEWHREYNKPHVINEDGVLVRKDELP